MTAGSLIRQVRGQTLSTVLYVIDRASDFEIGDNEVDDDDDEVADDEFGGGEFGDGVYK